MPTHEATCTGGPLDSETMTSRYPNGFILVNREMNEIIIYDQPEMAEAGWVAREPEIINWNAETPKNIRRAMMQPRYDIVSYNEGMGPWRR